MPAVLRHFSPRNPPKRVGSPAPPPSRRYDVLAACKAWGIRPWDWDRALPRYRGEILAFEFEQALREAHEADRIPQGKETGTADGGGGKKLSGWAQMQADWARKPVAGSKE